MSRQKKNSYMCGRGENTLGGKRREYIGREEEGEGWEMNTRREEVCPCEVGGEKEKVELKRPNWHHDARAMQTYPVLEAVYGASGFVSSLLNLGN